MTEDVLDKLDDLGADTESAIERFMGDVEMYLTYVQRFPQEPTYAALAAAMAAGDAIAAEKAAHALKGLANNMGFLPLADPAAELVLALRAADPPAANAAYQKLQPAYQDFCRAIGG